MPSLYRLEPHSRDSDDLKPVYVTPAGNLTTTRVGRKGLNKRYKNWYKDSVSNVYVSRRQRDRAISGVSYEYAAIQRKQWGPEWSYLDRYYPRTLEEYPEGVEPEGEYTVESPPPPMVAAPEEYRRHVYEPIDVVVAKFNSEYIRQYSGLMGSQGIAYEEYQTQLEANLAELEQLVRDRRAIGEDPFASRDDVAYANDDLNDYLRETLEYDDDDDFWRNFYPDK